MKYIRNPLKNAALMCMATQFTSKEQRIEIDNIFKAFDSNSNGTINKEKL